MQDTAVLVHLDLRGQTKEGYERLFALMRAQLERAPGFVMHAAYPLSGGWRVVETWKTRADADAFFLCTVAPRLTQGLRHTRQVVELHNLAGRRA